MPRSSRLTAIIDFINRLVGGEQRPTPTRPGRAHRAGPRRAPRAPQRPPRPYPGDFAGVPDIRYEPNPDGRPDPGEVVWTWVPFEENHGDGKDRPVLLIGRDGDWLLGLALTSRDHDLDTPGQRRSGRVWVDIGAGPWDRDRRPSEARIDRILRVDPEAVRREGAVLDVATFAEVARAVRQVRG